MTPMDYNSNPWDQELPESDDLDLSFIDELTGDTEAFDQYEDFSEIPTEVLSQPRPKPKAAYAKPPKTRKTPKILLLLLGIALVLCLFMAIAAIWLSGSFNVTTMLENILISDVNIGGMTKEEAAAAIEESVTPSFAQDLVLELPDATLTISAADAGISLDVDAILEAAWQYGRSGTWAENRAVRENAPNTIYELDASDYLLLDTEHIRSQLDAYCAGYNSNFLQSSVTIEGELPVLDTSDEKFNAEAPCQTLVMNTGTPNRYIDPDALYDQVMEAYLERNFQITAEAVEAEQLPENLTQQVTALHEQHTLAPVDSAFDRETGEASFEVYGYTFNLEAALNLLAEADYTETLEIPFEYVTPAVTRESIQELLFRDELAAYETKHTNNSNRNTNLKLACAAINGMVLMPGEQFDYNTALGKRTAEAGYKAADAYSGGQTVQTIGGGICQVSSTLYYCTLIADLQIDTRVAHSYTSSYMPLGMDATVSWGGPDFRFTNNTNYPIRIEAEVSGGYVKIKLIGTDEKDYYVKMEYEVLSNSYATTVTQEYPKDNDKGYKDGQVIQTAYNGCTVQSYKCKYSKETDELISREEEALSKYKKRDKIVVKLVSAPAETTPPATTPSTDAPEIT